MSGQRDPDREPDDLESEVAAKLGAYLDGELSQEETDSVRQLLETSPQAAATIQAYQAIDRAASGLLAPVVGPEDWSAVTAGIRRAIEPQAESPSAKIRWIRRPWVLAAAAAALVATLIIVVPLLDTGEKNTGPGYAGSTPYQVEVKELPMNDVEPDDIDGKLLLIDVHG